MNLTRSERLVLWTAALIGLVMLNGVFLWAVATRPDLVTNAMTNPVSAAFIVEALLLTGLVAYFLHRLELTRLSWPVVIVLSLAGGLLFALPLALLFERRPS